MNVPHAGTSHAMHVRLATLEKNGQITIALRAPGR